MRTQTYHKEEEKKWITKRKLAHASTVPANVLCRPLMSIAAYIVEMRQVARKLIAVAVIPTVCK